MTTLPSVPTVTATATDASAMVDITAASSLPGTTTVLVTAEDGTTTQSYMVSFTLSNDDALEDFSGYADGNALNAAISNATANATVTLVGGAMVLEGKNGADPFFTQVTLDVTDTSLDGIDSFTAEVSYVSGSRENLKIELLDAGGSVLATLNPVLALQNFSGTVMIDVSSITGTLSSVRFTYEAVDFGTISASFDDLTLVEGTMVGNSDATLSDLQVDGMTLDGFSSSTVTYSVNLLDGTTRKCSHELPK